MENKLNQSMKAYLSSYIQIFRTAFNQLSKEVKAHVSNLENFSGPCQVHLFWFRFEPAIDYSLLLCTRLKHQPDGLVEVIGPMKPTEVLSTLDNVISWERWQEKINDPMFYTPRDGEHSLQLPLASTLKQVKNGFDRFLLQSLYSGSESQVLPFSKTIFPGNGFTWEIRGDIRESDAKTQIEKVLEKAKEAANKPQPAAAEPPVKQPQIPGFCTYFYPSIWVGEIPVKTPQDLLHGRSNVNFRHPAKAFDMEYKGRKLVVNQDGFIAIEAMTKREAVENLNEIMSKLWLEGIEAYAIKEFEVGEAKINPKDVSIGSSSQTLSSLRSAKAFFLPLGPSDLTPTLLELTSRNVSVGDLRQIVSRAEAITKDPYNANILTFLLEARTHFAESEYRQSLIMAWLVVESWLEREWSMSLDSKHVSKNRKKRITESRAWTAEVVSESLNLLDAINVPELNLITNARRLRNNVVHEGHNPSSEEVRKVLDLALTLAKKYLN